MSVPRGRGWRRFLRIPIHEKDPDNVMSLTTNTVLDIFSKETNNTFERGGRVTVRP